jgi:hypothetical protein
MKKPQWNSRFHFLLIGIGVFALLIACQLSGTGPKGAISTKEASSQTPGQEQSNGSLNLPEPTMGLSALDKYHLIYRNTVSDAEKGQGLEFDLAIDRMVNGTDELELVQQTSSDLQPVNLNLAVLNGAGYTQQKTGGPCRTTSNGEVLKSSPALKLPPVFGANQVGVETLDSIPAIHYQIDEKSVLWPFGKDGKAQGDVWIAQEGGYVLKYELTIQQPTGDFQGSRSWTYQLGDIGSDLKITLPDGCLPLLTDIPIIDGASEVIQRPRFQKYFSGASLEQLSNFYNEKLNSAGWMLLASTGPEGGRESLSFIKNEDDGRGRLVVIQAGEENGKTVVIVQSAVTQKPITIGLTPGPGKVIQTLNPVETPELGKTSGFPEPTAKLPADLPQYPGAEIAIHTDQMTMSKTNDGWEKVIDYYKRSMDEAGFKLENLVSQNGVNTQAWVKDQLRIVIVIMQQGGKTQIVASVENN